MAQYSMSLLLNHSAHRAVPPFLFCQRNQLCSANVAIFVLLAAMLPFLYCQRKHLCLANISILVHRHSCSAGGTLAIFVLLASPFLFCWRQCCHLYSRFCHLCSTTDGHFCFANAIVFSIPMLPSIYRHYQSLFFTTAAINVLSLPPPLLFRRLHLYFRCLF